MSGARSILRIVVQEPIEEGEGACRVFVNAIEADKGCDECKPVVVTAEGKIANNLEEMDPGPSSF